MRLHKNVFVILFFLLLAVTLKDFLLLMSIIKRLVQVEFILDDQSCRNLSLRSIRDKLIEKCGVVFFGGFFCCVCLFFF